MLSSCDLSIARRASTLPANSYAAPIPSTTPSWRDGAVVTSQRLINLLSDLSFLIYSSFFLPSSALISRPAVRIRLFAIPSRSCSAHPESLVYARSFSTAAMPIAATVVRQMSLGISRSVSVGSRGMPWHVARHEGEMCIIGHALAPPRAPSSGSHPGRARTPRPPRPKVAMTSRLLHCWVPGHGASKCRVRPHSCLPCQQRPPHHVRPGAG